MTTKTCLYNKETLAEFHLNRLPLKEMQEVSLHLEDCVFCWQSLISISENSGIERKSFNGQSSYISCAVFDLRSMLLYLRDSITEIEREGISHHLAYCRHCPDLFEQANLILRNKCQAWLDDDLKAFNKGNLNQVLKELLLEHLDNCALCCGRLAQLEDNPSLATQSKPDEVFIQSIINQKQPEAKVSVIGTALKRKGFVSRRMLSLAATFCIASMLLIGFILLYSAKHRQLTVETANNIENLMRRGDVENAEKWLNSIAPREDLYKHPDCHALYLWGRMTSDNSNYKESIQLLSDSIKYADNHDDITIMKATMMLANTYHVHNKNDKALECAQKAYQLALKTDHLDYQSMMLQIEGISSLALGKSEDGERFLTQALPLAKLSQSNRVMIQNYTFLALINIEKRQFDKAADLFNTAQNIASAMDQDINRNLAFIQIYAYQGRGLAMQGKYNDAIDMYKKAFEIENNMTIHYPVLLFQLHESLAEVYQKSGDLQNSLIHGSKAETQGEIATEKCQSINLFLSFSPDRKPLPACP